MDLNHIKGIGEKTLKYLYDAGIFSVNDLVEYYPYRYQILSPSSLEETTPNLTYTINAIVTEVPKISFIKKNFNVLRMRVETYGKIVNVSIFNRAFFKQHLTIGKEITLVGKYDPKRNIFTASDIKLAKLEEMKILPVYHAVKGMKNSQLQTLIEESLKECIIEEDVIPDELVQKYHLISKKEAIKKLHLPKIKEDIQESKKRIIYEELFEFMFKIEYLKQLKEADVGIAKEFREQDILEFMDQLPFTLTADQRNGVMNGLKDLKSSKRMNRLLLGDVGAGKTIVASLLLYANYLAGYQSAFLAPTEILATQHFHSVRNLFKDTNFSIDILIGSMSKKEKESVLRRVKNHEIDLLIGTHAMLNKNLFFDELGFIITDEQHRFGVAQREFLSQKGNKPDMLFLSATPIPRTYALTIYGDMDTTIIKQKPNGRKDIETKVVKESNLKDVLWKVLEEVKCGHQIYVVAPMIEGEEDSNLKDVNLLKEKFEMAFHGKIPIGVLHGKLKKYEKEEIMNDFKVGNTKILISTTVIEVGVDVKDATVMIIFNAERFGLATLHQLRGRVGRNDLQSYCYLICNDEKPRLKVLEESNDGFYISEKDFEFRGEGDLFGVKQSGDMTFKLANLKRDYAILMKAKRDVELFIKSKKYLKCKHYTHLIENLDFSN